MISRWSMLMVDEQVDDGFPKVDGKKVDEGMIIHIYIYVYIYIYIQQLFF